ncbi:MAG: hypothetical protein ACI4LE_01745 [Faecalibacterium sp.]
MNKNTRIQLQQEVYEEMNLTPEMIRSIRTLCTVCLQEFVESNAYRIALVPNVEKCLDECSFCQTRRGFDYVVIPR